jgi:ABC-type uncharacterized transport system permease subunit
VREALGFLAWIIAGGYLLAAVRYRLDLAGAVLAPVVLGVLVAARLSPAGQPQADLTLLGRIHISLATVGIGVFALASALSAIYLLEERNLKQKRFDNRSFQQQDAPLEALDRMAQRLVLAGFPVFTVAMGLGIAWVVQRKETMLRPEYPIAIITWLLRGLSRPGARLARAAGGPPPRRFRRFAAVLGIYLRPRAG